MHGHVMRRLSTTPTRRYLDIQINAGRMPGGADGGVGI